MLAVSGSPVPRFHVARGVGSTSTPCSLLVKTLKAVSEPGGCSAPKNINTSLEDVSQNQHCFLVQDLPVQLAGRLAALHRGLRSGFTCCDRTQVRCTRGGTSILGRRGGSERKPCEDRSVAGGWEGGNLVSYHLPGVEKPVSAFFM